MVRKLMIAGSLVAAFTGDIAEPFKSAAVAQPEETTVVGCLRAGANSGEFGLADDEHVTYQVQPAEELDLSAHLGHRVELTGTVDKTDDGS